MKPSALRALGVVIVLISAVGVVHLARGPASWISSGVSASIHPLVSAAWWDQGASNSMSGSSRLIRAGERSDSPSSNEDLTDVVSQASAISSFAAWADAALSRGLDTLKSEEWEEGLKRVRLRREVMAVLIVNDPALALKTAAPPVWRRKLPADFVREMEEPIHVRGDLEVVGVLPFRPEEAARSPGFRGIERWVSAEDGRRWRAYVYGNREGTGTVKAASIHGVALDGKLAIDERPLVPAAVEEVAVIPSEAVCGISSQTFRPNAESLAAAWNAGSFEFFCEPDHREMAMHAAGEHERHGSARPAATLGNRKLLYIPVAFADEASAPATEEEIRSAMDQVADFLHANSGGRLSLVTTITPPIKLPLARSEYLSDRNKLRRDAIAGANGKGFDEGNFDLDVVRSSPMEGAFAGYAYILSRGAWLHVSDPRVAVHEIGHNLGLLHANGLMAIRRPYPVDAEVREYGNVLDVMGSGDLPWGHFTASSKNFLGWLPTEAIEQVRESGEYVLVPHDDPGLVQAGPRVLRLELQGVDYWLEARRTPNGRESAPGVFMNRPSLRGTELVDFTPFSSEFRELDIRESEIPAGYVWSDPSGTVRIVLTEVESNGVARLRISFSAVDEARRPEFSVEVSASRVVPGDEVKFAASWTPDAGMISGITWDFSDGTSVYGLKEVRRIWSIPGDYHGACTVRLWDGSSRTRSVVVRVGNPRRSSVVNGRVLFEDIPLEGAQVDIGSQSMTTDDLGVFQAAGFRPGNVSMRVSHRLFSATRRTWDLNLTNGLNAVGDLNFYAGQVQSVRVVPSLVMEKHPNNQLLEVRVELEAEPGSVVDHVLYFVNGFPVRTNTVPPYQVELALTNGGSHRLSASVTSGLGKRVIVSPEVMVAVEAGPPANDRIEAAESLGDGELSVTRHNLGATAESGDPADLEASVWWKWKPNPGGFYTASAAWNNGSGRFGVRVFRGEDRVSLTPVSEGTGQARFVAETNVTYWLQVHQVSGLAGFFNLRLDRYPPPSNDRYSARQIISAGLPVKADTQAATVDSDEPAEILAAGEVSVWFEYSANQGGACRVNLAGSGGQTIRVYEIQSQDRRVRIGEGVESVEWTSHGSSAYAIAVCSAAVRPAGGPLTVRMGEDPVNDVPEKAISILRTGVTYLGTTAGARQDPKEPAPGIWWKWESRTNQSTVVLSSSIDGRIPEVLVWRSSNGSPGVLEVEGRGAVTFDSRVGETYWITTAIAGLSGLRVNVLPAADNDSFDRPAVLVGSPTNRLFVAAGATADPRDPGIGGTRAATSLWFVWTNVIPGQATVQVVPQSGGRLARIGIYRREDPLAWTAVPVSGPQTSLSFPAPKDEVFWIMAEASPGGVFDLRISVVPGNDAFVLAVPLVGRRWLENFSPRRATREAEEPSHGGRTGPGYGSLWWRWVAPADGGYVLSGNFGSPATFLGVYEYDWLNELAGLGFVAGSLGARQSVGFHATKDVEYFIVVDQQTGIFAGRIQLEPGPGNDDVANAAEFPADVDRLQVVMKDSSLEPNEFSHGEFEERGSLWYRWTAPTHGGYGFSATGGDGRLGLAVYSGTSVTNLIAVSPPSVAATDGVHTAVAAAQGSTYLIVVAAGKLDGPPVTLRIRPAPTNDLFATRGHLGAAPVNVELSALGSTVEPGEPDPSGDGAGATVWWSWTASEDGGVSISVQTGDGYAARLAHSGAEVPRVGVFTGDTLTSLQRFAASRDGRLSFRARAGTTYHISVGDVARVGQPLRLSLRSGPENDDLAGRFPVQGTNWLVTAHTFGATREESEPAPEGVTSTVWWEWTAPVTGVFGLQASSADGRLWMAVYSPTPGGGVRTVAESADMASGTPGLVMNVAAGETYFISVGTGPSASQFRVQLSSALGHDSALNAVSLESGVAGQLHSTFPSSREAAEMEGGYPGAHSVWYRYTAGTEPAAQVRVREANGPLKLGVYVGSPWASMQPVLNADVPAGGDLFRGFPVVTGRDYWIRIAATSAVPVLHSVSISVPPTNDVRANARLIAGIGAAHQQDFQGATRSDDDPDALGYPGAGSVWYRWDSPNDGTFGLRVLLTLDKAVAHVYRADTNGVLQWLGSGVSPESGSPATVPFRAGEGVPIWIRIESLTGIGSPLTLRVDREDVFDRIESPAEQGAARLVEVFGATAEPTDPPVPGFEKPLTKWWKYKATVSGPSFIRLNQNVRLCGVAVFRLESDGALRWIASGTNSVASSPVLVPVELEAHREYRVAALDYRPAFGTQSLEVISRPVNDAFESASLLEIRVLRAGPSVAAASTEPGESIGGDTNGLVSTWHRFSVPVSTNYVVTLVPLKEGDSLDGTIHLGDTLERLTHVPARSVQLGGQRRIYFQGRSGREYRLAILGRQGYAGEYTVRVTAVPPNDLFEDRIRTEGTNVVVTGRSVGAATDGPPGANVPVNSVWYEWVAPADGLLQLELATSNNVPASIGFQYEDLLGRIQALGTGDGVQLRGSFFVARGTRYFFSIGSFRNSVLDGLEFFQLRLSLLSFEGETLLDSGQWFKGVSRWTVSPAIPFFTQFTTVVDDPDAARSGPINTGASWMETSVRGPGVVTFWWKVSCDPSESSLAFFDRSRIGGEIPVASITGEQGWRPFRYVVPAGEHLLRWTYTKRARAREIGRDTGWIDRLEYVPDAVVENPLHWTSIRAPDVRDAGSTNASENRVEVKLSSGRDGHAVLEVSEDLVQWGHWLKAGLTMGTNSIPPFTITNQSRLFFRARSE